MGHASRLILRLTLIRCLVDAKVRFAVGLNGATRKVLKRKVLMRKVPNLKIGLRVDLTARRRRRTKRT